MTATPNPELKACAVALCKKLRLIHDNPYYQSVWISYQNHGGDYTNGPKYDKELDALETAIRNARASIIPEPINDQALTAIATKWSDFYYANQPKVTLQDCFKLAIEDFTRFPASSPRPVEDKYTKCEHGVALKDCCEICFPTQTPTMSETARTDAIVKPYIGNENFNNVEERDKLLDHARQLERELGEAKKLRNCPQCNKGLGELCYDCQAAYFKVGKPALTPEQVSEIAHKCAENYTRLNGGITNWADLEGCIKSAINEAAAELQKDKERMIEILNDHDICHCGMLKSDCDKHCSKCGKEECDCYEKAN